MEAANTTESQLQPGIKPNALSILQDVDGAIGGLVRAYTARDDTEEGWLESWFSRRSGFHYSSSIPKDEQIVPIKLETSDTPKSAQQLGLKLVSIKPHYFRGFKALPGPINFGGALVVLEGKNSSGKTSLAEALEFLFRGSLSRREDHDEGNPEELENCIENQLRPRDEDTFVEAVFVKNEGTTDEKQIALRRLLTRDYGTTRTSICESKLYMDGTELSREAEEIILEELFSSVPPLLMQHTLRSFVQSPPSQRRRYFERILSLDELTDLIGSAVIGNAKLPDFKSPKEGYGLLQWQTLVGQLKNTEAKTAAQKVPSVSQTGQQKALTEVLIRVAGLEFGSTAIDLPEAEASIEQRQQKARQESFPPLGQLKPKRQPNEDLLTSLTASKVRKSNIEARWKEYESARASTNAVRTNALEIADALESLVKAGLIDRAQAIQVCPLCVHDSPATLTQERLLEIEGWKPLVEAERKARATFDLEVTGMKKEILSLIQEANDTLPTIPPLDEHLKGVSLDLSKAVAILVDLRAVIEPKVREPLDKAQILVKKEPNQISTLEEAKAYAEECTDCIDGLRELPKHAEEYRQGLRPLETIVGQTASSSEDYRLRQSWLSCVKSSADILDDFKWERAKRESQKDIADIRKELMEFRGQYLEGQRASFSEGMQQVWSSLRGDTYSVFSNLEVPEPKGKGFPVVIEVKATLNDGVVTKEIDALKVFSESQVNALGVAAFVTRSRLLGHGLLIFDDPVQSMDEDHFKTFARDVLPPILDEGRQVIILTHNETFARDISYWHHERSGYVTLGVRMSQKEGCLIDEGNRRFSERLRNAEKLAKEGEHKESWTRVRFAIERLYTIVNVKYGPSNFNPDSWRDQAAEYMWDGGGVGVIVDGKDPEAGKRLKEILTMTVGGAHDKGEAGLTDLIGATKYLRELGSKMKVSD